MKAFVTGATGFLGGELTHALSRLGIEVVALGRNTRKKEILESSGAKFISGDLSNTTLLKQASKTCDIIVHCAALSSPWGSEQQFIESNLQGTRNIVEAALENNIKRLIYISTPSIYIEKRHRLDVTEHEPLPSEMINHYARTKYLGEQEVMRGVLSGLETIIIRPQGIFGENDTAILPRLIRIAKTKGFIPQIGNEQVLIDLTAVENVVLAIIAAINAEGAALNQAYNITNGEPCDQMQMIEFVLNKISIPYRIKNISFRKAWAVANGLEWFHQKFIPHKEPLLTKQAVCALAFSRTLNIEKARKLLGYTPQVKLFDGLEKSALAFKKKLSLGQNI